MDSGQDNKKKEVKQMEAHLLSIIFGFALAFASLYWLGRGDE